MGMRLINGADEVEEDDDLYADELEEALDEAGLDESDIEYMSSEERREFFEENGIDPEEYGYDSDDD